MDKKVLFGSVFFLLLLSLILLVFESRFKDVTPELQSFKSKLRDLEKQIEEKRNQKEFEEEKKQLGEEKKNFEEEKKQLGEEKKQFEKSKKDFEEKKQLGEEKKNFETPTQKLQNTLLNESSFYEIAKKYGTDKVSPHHYNNIYDRYLPAFRYKKTKLLEVGLGCNMDYGPGASYHVWREYFPNLELHFIEIDKTCSEKWQSQVDCKIHVGSQGDVSFLYNAMDSTGGNFDIIVDDGSHINVHQIVTLCVLLPFLRPGGLFFIEDMLTSYLPSWGGAQDGPRTMVQFTKSLLDGLNRNIEFISIQTPYEISHYIESIHCFEELCVFERNNNLTMSPRRTQEYYENTFFQTKVDLN